MNPILEAKAVSRYYEGPTHTVKALRSVDIRVEPASLVAIRGRSGSGKTTLLNVLGGLDTPTTGEVWLDGLQVSNATESELVELRRHKVSYIFQSFGLIPILSAAENVHVPMRLTKTSVGERERRTELLLDRVGLKERAHHRPHELSGGEQQRVAIARALASDPVVLIADEPTGQLDSRTGRSIIDLISSLVKNEGLAAVFATHDPAPLALADQVLELSDGRLVE